LYTFRVPRQRRWTNCPLGDGISVCVWGGTIEQLKQYLCDYANLSNETVPYDTEGVFQLFLALADNLQENAPKVDLRAIAPNALGVRQAAFLAELARLAGQS
jgi:hypothetical protein